MISTVSVAPAFPAGFLGPVELQGFDAIEQASPAWDHAHQQLGRGSARVRVTTAQAPRMELGLRPCQSKSRNSWPQVEGVGQFSSEQITAPVQVMWQPFPGHVVLQLPVF